MAGTLLRRNEAQFRKILLVFAVVLAIAVAWTLISELARAPRIGFPIDQNYQAAADQRWRAALAARVGMVRGDLWAELFFSFANSILIPGSRFRGDRDLECSVASGPPGLGVCAFPK